jgi:hypothetical protein
MIGEDLNQVCSTDENVSQVLQGVEDKFFPWADRKEKLYKIYFKELMQHKEVAREMDEDWHILTSNQFAAGKIFGSPTRLTKFLKQNRQFLTPEEKDIIRFFVDNPWFYSLFSVEKVIEKNFLRIYDYCKNRSFLLFSPGVFRMHREGKKIFLCLLLNSGECYQTYGLINYFQGFNVRDIRCFAGFTSFHFKNTGDLSLAISYNPVPFFLLYRYAEIPVVVHNNEPVIFCGHSLKVDDFQPENYSTVFNIKEKNGIFKCTTGKNKSSFNFANVYYDSKKRILMLHASGLERYRFLVNKLSKSYDIPDEPSWHVSALMSAALKDILGVKEPVLQYEKLFTKKPDPVTSREIKRLNAVMAELMEKHNYGQDYSAEEIARKYDAPLEMVRQLQATLTRSRERFKIDIKGGFKNFTPPPPAERHKFAETFRDNSIFEFRGSPHAEALFNIKGHALQEVMEEFDFETLTLAELPELIEDLFYSSWEGKDSTVLLYTIYLISRKGKNFEKVSDYAVEFLKVFWHIILPSKSRERINGFIREYGVFCFEVLYRVGLIDIDRELDNVKAMKSDYKMKASDFFNEWIRFVSSH